MWSPRCSKTARNERIPLQVQKIPIPPVTIVSSVLVLEGETGSSRFIYQPQRRDETSDPHLDYDSSALRLAGEIHPGISQTPWRLRSRTSSAMAIVVLHTPGFLTAAAEKEGESSAPLRRDIFEDKRVSHAVGVSSYRKH